MEKKNKIYKKKVLLPQYSTTGNEEYTITIVVTDDVDAYCNKVFPAANAEGGGAAHVYKHFESHIVLPFDSSIGTVVHECWHAVYRIMKSIGAELENEVVAYTLGWLTELVTGFLYSTPEYKKLL